MLLKIVTNCINTITSPKSSNPGYSLPNDRLQEMQESIKNILRTHEGDSNHSRDNIQPYTVYLLNLDENPWVFRVQKVNLLKIIIINADDDVNYCFYINDVNNKILKYVKIRRGWVINGPKGWRIRKDPAHNGQGKEHIHICKNDEFVVINFDGTRRHSDGKEVELPKKLWDWIKENMPYITLPKDRMLKVINRKIPDHDILVTVDLNLDKASLYL